MLNNLKTKSKQTEKSLLKEKGIYIQEEKKFFGIKKNNVYRIEIEELITYLQSVQEIEKMNLLKQYRNLCLFGNTWRNETVGGIYFSENTKSGEINLYEKIIEEQRGALVFEEEVEELLSLLIKCGFDEGLEELRLKSIFGEKIVYDDLIDFYFKSLNRKGECIEELQEFFFCLMNESNDFVKIKTEKGKKTND